MLTLTLVLSTAVFAIPGPRVEVVACALQRHVMFCPVDVGLSAPLGFVVDTGTRRTVLDAGVAARLGLAATPDSIIALGGDVAGGDVRLSRVRFGSLFVFGVRASVTDLHVLEASTHVRAGGILGMDVLGRANLTIDYRHASVTIGLAEALSRRAPLVHTSSDFPAVDVEVGRQRLRLVVDTGADGVLVFATRGAMSEARDVVDAGGLAGSSQVNAERVGRIRLAGWGLRGDSVAVVDAADAKQAYDGDGVLGIKTLDASVISLDFSHGELRWEP
jgi:predicted aspartyl protease